MKLNFSISASEHNLGHLPGLVHTQEAMVGASRIAAILVLAIAPAAGFSPLGSTVSLRQSHAAPAVSVGRRVPLALALHRNAPRGGLLGMRASSTDEKSAKALAAPLVHFWPLPLAGISSVTDPRLWPAGPA